MESAFEALSDDELKAKTQEFRDRLSGGETLQQFYQKHSQRYAKQVSVCLVCAILMCSLSVGWY